MLSRSRGSKDFDPFPVAFAIDIDGTLLCSDRSLACETVMTLRHVQERGIKVVLASARPPRSVLALAHTIGLSGSMIALNGACLIDTSGIVLQSAAIEPEISLSLRQHLESQNDIETHYYSGFDWFTGPNVDAECEAANIGFRPSLGPDVDGRLELHKIMIVGAPSRLKAVDAWLRGQSLPVIASLSSIDYLEITASAATKGSAMLALANRSSLDLERCIAIGDGDNDLSLFDVCGTGVAMANASERLRAAADVIIGTNDDNGVHLYISELLADHGNAERSQTRPSPHPRTASRS